MDSSAVSGVAKLDPALTEGSLRARALKSEVWAEANRSRKRRLRGVCRSENVLTTGDALIE